MPSHITQLTYAVGDIHGYDGHFERLIDRIRVDAELAGERPRIILLGDYIDRGPASRQVLERILRLEAATWCDLIALKGNHEDALLRFLDEPIFGDTWRDWGGETTLASYGVAMPFFVRTLEEWEDASAAFARAIDPTHRAMLERLPASYQADDYLFVHAGVDPDRPLADQGPETLMYIRGRFLRSEKACDYVVVHGHTPEHDPSNTPWRIGVDTGIYFNGILTAVRLHGETRSFLRVEDHL
jgi:serine/threonine protein phosphatase 1